MADAGDELNLKIAGRLITIEILIVLLLRQKPDVSRIMREADVMLRQIEDDLHEGGASVHAIEVLSAARAALDRLTAESAP
jgi:hypothetical protein